MVRARLLNRVFDDSLVCCNLFLFVSVKKAFKKRDGRVATRRVFRHVVVSPIENHKTRKKSAKKTPLDHEKKSINFLLTQHEKDFGIKMIKKMNVVRHSGR